jgi:hypothetical protein
MHETTNPKFKQPLRLESEVSDASKRAVFNYTFTLSNAVNTQRN